MQDPFKGLRQDDFIGAFNAESQNIAFERLHTSTLEAVFFPTTGRLILLFPNGHRQHFESNDVKALTSFLDQHVKATQPVDAG